MIDQPHEQKARRELYLAAIRPLLDHKLWIMKMALPVGAVKRDDGSLCPIYDEKTTRIVKQLEEAIADMGRSCSWDHRALTRATKEKK